MRRRRWAELDKSEKFAVSCVVTCLLAGTVLVLLGASDGWVFTIVVVGVLAAKYLVLRLMVRLPRK